jgi:hypothetical protein
MKVELKCKADGCGFSKPPEVSEGCIGCDDLIVEPLITEKTPVPEVPCSDGLFGVTVKKEKTPSGWMQPYVSLKINNVEFKRTYHTGESAIRCAMRMTKILNLTETK